MVINVIQNKEERKIESTRRQQIVTLNRFFREDDAMERREGGMGTQGSKNK